MNFPFYIARRYLFSKKSHNAINIISMVSVCGVVVATIALVCALSVLNGFVSLVSSMLSNFDPELKILPAHGKVFDPTLPAVQEVKKLPGVALFCEVLQDNALVRYRDRQIVTTVKGVDDTFAKLTRIDSILIDSRDGKFVLSDEVANFASLGVGTATLLGVRANYSDPLEIYVPKRDEKVNLANPASSFNLDYAFIGSVYATNQQMYDENFMLLPLPLVRSLFHYEKEVSAIELALAPGADVNSVKSQIKSLLGENFWVKDRYEQQEASFKMMQGEKWMIFLILCFILILALFNVIGSLSMLMIEKKEDVRTLRNMGADDRLIRRIFLFEGWMISGLGALIGVVIGLALCLLQQELGIIKLGQAAGSFIIDAYPVRVEVGDIFIVFITVLTIGFLAAWYPVHYLGKKWLDK
ncbi:FtsX-like permease family protein [uncultured Parabacteroides sp.]|uniref:FtsX-like permease family protein n=1 Tax=uncultured Parabacteroides sp. TaxID=512312 RepID=UPI0025E2ED14|nr:FtsX-like permease family protein [uncultured Parabacteroides sp.]